MAQWVLGQRVLYSISFWHIVTPKKLLNESWMKKMEHLALKTLDGSNYQKSIMSMQQQQQLPLVALNNSFSLCCILLLYCSSIWWTKCKCSKNKFKLIIDLCLVFQRNSINVHCGIYSLMEKWMNSQKWKSCGFESLVNTNVP